MNSKKIVSYMTMILVAVGLNGCGEDSTTGSNSSGDSANKVIFNSIDNDSFSITLERNNNDYYHVAYKLMSNDNQTIILSGINSKGKAVLTCNNSFSTSDSNRYACIEKYSLESGSLNDVQRDINLYGSKTYSLDMYEYEMDGATSYKENVTHIKTLQGEY